jgi:hypothetical protein
MSSVKLMTIKILLLCCGWLGAQSTGEHVMADNISSMLTLLPDTVRGWTAKEKNQYNRDNLYDYIDGGAELYLSYGFIEMVNFTYDRKDQPSLVVDIFDMGSSENAFGVFSYSRETIDSTYGQGSQYNPGLLLFWKDRYYISILASPETSESRETVFRLASLIDNKIPKRGPLPQIISLLPSEGLLDASIRYFKHHIWLNSYYFISDQNIFHIDTTTNAVLAKYRDGSLLLLIIYPGTAAATNAYQDFILSFMPENPSDHVIQIEDGSWVACRISGNAIKAVFKAVDRQKALELLNRVPEFR